MRRLLSRVGVAILFSALLVVGAALPAVADGPVVREPFPQSDEIVTDVCAFPFEITLQQNKQVLTVWVEKDGSYTAHVVGQVKATWTNLNTGYSVSRNWSGPVLVRGYPDGSEDWRVLGPNQMWIWWTWGQLEAKFGPTGELLWLDFHGRGEEICPLLDH